MILSMVASANTDDIPPGAYTNDKLRLGSIAVTDGAIPIIFNADFFVRDSDGLSRQQNTQDLFILRWNVQILKGGSVVRTINKDEPILPPFTWEQLPRLNGEGTEPFVKVISTISWDLKNEQGQAVPGSTFAYQLYIYASIHKTDRPTSLARFRQLPDSSTPME